MCPRTLSPRALSLRWWGGLGVHLNSSAGARDLGVQFHVIRTRRFGLLAGRVKAATAQLRRVRGLARHDRRARRLSSVGAYLPRCTVRGGAVGSCSVCLASLSWSRCWGHCPSAEHALCYHGHLVDLRAFPMLRKSSSVSSSAGLCSIAKDDVGVWPSFWFQGLFPETTLELPLPSYDESWQG